MEGYNGDLAGPDKGKYIARLCPIQETKSQGTLCHSCVKRESDHGGGASRKWRLGLDTHLRWYNKVDICTSTTHIKHYLVQR